MVSTRTLSSYSRWKRSNNALAATTARTVVLLRILNHLAPQDEVFATHYVTRGKCISRMLALSPAHHMSAP